MLISCHKRSGKNMLKVKVKRRVSHSLERYENMFFFFLLEMGYYVTEFVWIYRSKYFLLLNRLIVDAARLVQRERI